MIRNFIAIAAVLAMIAAGCASSVASAPATVEPSPVGIPSVSGGAGSTPIQMVKGDTKYSISFPKIDLKTTSSSFSDIPDGFVLLVFDVTYEVQSGSLDIVGSSDFEGYVDNVAADSASFGYGLTDLGYVTLLPGTSASGQFGYLVPKTGKDFVLFFVDRYAAEPRIWQMKIDLSKVLGN